MKDNNVNALCLHSKTLIAGMICLIMAGIYVLVNHEVHGRMSQAVNKSKLSIQDPRPLAKAIEMLEAKYGWVITYEDPRFVHESEIADVTAKVRRDLDKYESGKAPKVLIPKGGKLEFEYDVSIDTNRPKNPVTLLRHLLNVYSTSGNAGRFRLESNGNVFHVIPVAVKNIKGALVPQKSILDTLISFPAEDRSVLKKMKIICEAISQKVKIPVDLGGTPTNFFIQRHDNRGAVNQKTRDILIQTLKALDNETRLSWQLFYDPGLKRYMLNFLEVTG